jgi:capsid portal protein
MGYGFSVTSSYHGVDSSTAYDPNAKAQLNMVNTKKKTYAESRNKLFESILRDNGGDSLFARMVENASVVGDAVLKAWYDEDDGKYKLDMVEAVEHFYVVWNYLLLTPYSTSQPSQWSRSWK